MGYTVLDTWRITQVGLGSVDNSYYLYQWKIGKWRLVRYLKTDWVAGWLYDWMDDWMDGWAINGMELKT